MVAWADLQQPYHKWAKKPKDKTGAEKPNKVVKAGAVKPSRQRRTARRKDERAQQAARIAELEAQLQPKAQQVTADAPAKEDGQQQTDSGDGESVSPNQTVEQGS